MKKRNFLLSLFVAIVIVAILIQMYEIIPGNVISYIGCSSSFFIVGISVVLIKKYFSRRNIKSTA